MFQPTDSDNTRLAAVHEKERHAAGKTFAIVASTFNDFIVGKLVKGARVTLLAAGAGADDIATYRCPGALELPGVVRRLVDSGRFAGVIVLGCVIRGETAHFDLVVGEATRGVGAIAAEGRCAIANGILACENLDQAVARSGADGNRGAEAATVVVEMTRLYDQIARDLAGAGKR
ncbi:MAG: 6,7-dimethyl-8-ribityllumazine synthase [Myxococcales bacterium]|jgi:6,7-dimethyl-8-ribityllumazine synthase|nr:6,7-dimethyl-8-ribityllumazine synthase [Myxococcales bacterium]